MSLQTLNRNRKELLLVALILLVAAFLRLYKIREFAIFLGDEGRDALVVKRMIVDHKFTLLGPTASVGGFYLGPVYYYFMIPFLVLSAFDPVGPAVMVALIGIATVALVYWTARSWVSVPAAIVASTLYATAPEIVNASRSSWNPNIMPFFALLSLFSLWYGVVAKKMAGFLLSGIAVGVAIQSHYLGLVLGPILFVATLLTTKPRRWAKELMTTAVGFTIGASLFFAFEMRHQFPNTRNVIEFVTRGGATTGPRSLNLIWLLFEMMRRTFESTFPTGDILTKFLVPVSLLSCVAFFLKEKPKGAQATTAIIILVYLLVGEFGIGFYKGQLYPHYFGFLFPLPFLLVGITISVLHRWRIGRIIGIGIAFLLLILNLTNQSIWGQGSNLIDQTRRVSEKVSQISGGRPFNFALIANGNSDHAYRYFLEVHNRRPTPLEERVEEQLIVVCELIDKPCQTLGHPLWEIAGFGRSEIARQDLVEPGIGVIRLVHHPDSQDLIGNPAPKGR